MLENSENSKKEVTPITETPVEIQEKETVNDVSEEIPEVTNSETVEIKEEVVNDVSEENLEATNSETKKEEKTDYTILSLDALVSSLEKLIASEPIQKIKNEVNEIKNNFNTKFGEFVALEKAKFVAEGGTQIDFHISTPIKNTFFGLVKDYRTKVQAYYNEREKDRNQNYTDKLALVEELKMLTVSSESSTMFNELKEIQRKWKTIGAVPFDKNEDLWQTFRFHEQKVYDFLHLRSDFRNLDFKHNLVEKTKMVNRAEELAQLDDNQKAFKELQILHRLWKEDIGPVAREFREEIWERFSAATKIIHDKRQELLTELEAKWEENVPKKEAVILKIKELISENITSHNLWQNKIKELQTLRDEFFKVGKVTNSKKDELWEDLRVATRNFNKHKNDFYKNVKSEHQINLDKKQALIKKADELKESDDFELVANTYKKIQAEWKTIGHVPRKFSDKLWKEFRGACNHFFDRMHAVQDEENKELLVVFEAKKAYLDNLKKEIETQENVALDQVKIYIKEWKEFGQVPQKMRFIESKFNRVIDKLFSKLDMDKNTAVMLRFKNNIDAFIEQNDVRKLDNETQFIRKKIDEGTKEVKLLENNLGFFKHATKDNPLVKNVYKNIEKHQEDLAVWQEKLKYLRSIDY